MTKDTTFRKASDVYTDPALVVMCSDPTTSRQDALEFLQRWVEKQGRSWPPVLGAVVLARKMQCIYVPYLLIDGTVSFDWSAVVGTQRTRQRNCFSCGGSGRRAVTNTQYSSSGVGRTTTSYHSCYSCGGSGRATESYEARHRESGSVVDRAVADHIVDAARGEMKDGAPDLQTALRNANYLSEDSGISMVPAATQTVEEVKRRLYERVNQDATRIVQVAAGRKGRVKSVKRSAVDYAKTRVWVHLYPVWLSHYTYGNRVRAVEVDAHTGRVYVEEPASVLVKRFLKRVSLLAAACCAVVVASWLSAEPGAQDLWSRLRMWMGMAGAPEVNSGARSEPPAARASSDASEAPARASTSGARSESPVDGVSSGASEVPARASTSGARSESPVDGVSSGASEVPARATTASTSAVVDSTAAETEALVPAGDASRESRPAATPAGIDAASVRGVEDTATGDLVDGTENGVSVVAPPPEAVRVGGAIPRPAKLRNVVPEYPPIARAARIQGIVILEVVVGVDGRVTRVRVLRSVPQLDEAAVEAAKQWEYAPTRQNGVPVSAILTETVNFRLP